jgi:hypothetical protein
MKKTEWGFFVDPKTGKMRLAVPKQKEFKPIEILHVLNGATHFLTTVLALLNSSIKEVRK